MARTIENVGVLGAGQMGNGIAQVAAAAGLNVVMVDRDDTACARGMQTIEGSLARLLKREKLTAEARDAILSRIRTSTTYDDFAGSDIVIEAVTENRDVKLAVFKQLDAVCRPGAILASNTSSISLTWLGAQTGRPGDVIGMHFMNPVPVMQLVEVIRGLATSDDTYEETKSLAERFGKSTVKAEDYPGFIVNRILMPMINEACYVLMEGTGSVADIDTGMKLGTNQPMGPLALADLIGLDTCLAIMEVLHDGSGDTKYRPCPLLRKYVDAGYLGRKTGRGFYQY
ncbi:MAG: 3-hydroxybutyryl-CoA dehydrogenase [Myxococcales bacterium]|nr:3-hydroxybutyryl-CoA dehydrogenase [Myxococcales bacterium]MCB9534125.1 3-hydroxybutyryl-CoA dehydrogenase [Myxococcales bacterium]